MTDSSAVETLNINREFNASIDRVFNAWTTADVLSQWFGPEGFIVRKAEMDLCIGGKYVIEMESPDGNLIKHSGNYVDIQPNQQLVFTWILEDQQCAGSEGHHLNTLVTILFDGDHSKTSISLTHEKLPTQQSIEGHRYGWSSSFNNLEQILPI